MPIYSYRCAACGDVTDAWASIADAPSSVRCEHCGSDDTRRIIARVAYHASEAAKSARLDPKYDRMVDHALKRSASADPDRLLKKMKPFAKD